MKIGLSLFLRNAVRISGVLTSCILVASVHAQNKLPAPPRIGNTTLQQDDPIGYMIGSLRYILFLVMVVLVAGAIVVFASGIISELNNARERGAWGKFGLFVAAGIFVILAVVAGAWWGSDLIMTQLN